MKYGKKKKKLPLIWILVPVVVLVIAAVILVAALSGGQESQDPTLPTDSGETASQATDGTDSTGDTAGETAPGESSPEEPTGETDATEVSDPTEDTQATDATTATGDKETEPTKPTSGEQKEDQTALKTPYCTLKYPQEWAGFLRVEISESDVYTATYYADLESGKSQELFTISFGGSMESAIGTITASGKTVPVHASSTDFQPDSSWTDQESYIVFSMQEAMNFLLDAMPIETASQPPQGDPNLPEEDGKEMVIDTPYGGLHYPSRWKDYLEVKVNDKNGYSVEFLCKVEGHDPVALFVVHYGGSKGIAVSTAKDANGKSVDVRMEVLEIDLDATWSEDDKSIVAAMQEDLNYLLSKLG